MGRRLPYLHAQTLDHEKNFYAQHPIAAAARQVRTPDLGGTATTHALGEAIRGALQAAARGTD